MSRIYHIKSYGHNKYKTIYRHKSHKPRPNVIKTDRYGDQEIKSYNGQKHTLSGLMIP